jgi:hypothetical protein
VILGGDNMPVAGADKREGPGRLRPILRIGGVMVLRRVKEALPNYSTDRSEQYT